MNGKHKAGTPGQEGSEESEFGAAIELMRVCNLEPEVSPAGDQIKLRMDRADESGRTAAAIWCTPERARDLAAQLIQSAEVAEQFEEAEE